MRALMREDTGQRFVGQIRRHIDSRPEKTENKRRSGFVTEIDIVFLMNRKAGFLPYFEISPGHIQEHQDRACQPHFR